jgi:ketosteroid isomerase-like protein
MVGQVWAGQGLNDEERRLVEAYVRASESLDMDGLGALLREDLRFAMPPQPGVWVGRDETVKGWVDGGFGRGDYVDWKCRTTTANGQPAVARYLRRPGASTYEAFSMDVLRIEDGRSPKSSPSRARCSTGSGCPGNLRPADLRAGKSGSRHVLTYCG